MTQQYTHHDFTPINPPSIKPEQVGWYVVNPDWVRCQWQVTNPLRLSRFDFAYWNGSIWTLSNVQIGLQLFWFGLKEEA